MKKGFTLTEILITMGIIGVVAALAVPNISAKINRNTIGVTLARAVELTETGFASMLNVARENAGQLNIDPGSISRISTLEQMLFDRIPGHNANVLTNGIIYPDTMSYFGVDSIDENENRNMQLKNAYDNVLGNDSRLLYKFKKVNANLILINDQNNDNNIADNPDVVIRRIYFDVNGANNPNSLGEDIFLFGLTDSGHLVPAGSQAYNRNTWNGNIQINQCNGDTIPNGNDANGNDRRLSCAARVAQDGWRVNYSF